MEEDLELNLGLSLGGCFRKYEKSEAAKSDLTSSTNLGDTHLDSEAKKREIQALRRQEARKKRDEKKRGRSEASKAFVVSAQNSEIGSEPALKRINCDENGENQSVASQIQTPISTNSSASMLPLQYHHFPPVQYAPLGNGFPFPYHMVPCWAAAAAAGAGAVATPSGSGAAAEEKNVFHPVACRPFKGLEVQGREGQEQSVSSSSAVSESLNGLSSRETSHSVESKSDQHQVQASVKSNAEGQQSVHSDSSHQTQPTEVLVEENTQTNKIDSSNNNNHQSAQTKALEEPIRTQSPPIQTTLRKNNGDNNNKPPKPQTKPPQPPLLRTQSLPHMPCVSTTGDGPNGKTINGFLYKYSRTEVSIMCVCHGSSFTPAEFVKHAGGTDVSHPLKHIVVIPSAFG